MKPFCYFFGYGSLMYPDGINDRGMNYKYTWDDLIPLRINRFKRGMFAASPFRKTAYYGLLRGNENDEVLGVLFPIFDEEDLNALLINEMAHSDFNYKPMGRMYEPIYLLKLHDEAGDGSVYNVMTLLNPLDRTSGCSAPQSYLAHVWRGIQPWGDDFCKEFLETGGLKPKSYANKLAPIYTAMKKVKKFAIKIQRI